MKAVAPRIERMYAEEVERWKASWQQFDRTFWSHLTYDEQRAYNELCRLRDSDKELWETVCDVADAWFSELHEQFPDDEKDTEEATNKANAFFEAFWDAVPNYKDEVDLTRWPAGLPYPEWEDLDRARKEEGALLRLCRRDKGNGQAERIAAAFLIWQMAVFRTARVYSSEVSPR